MKATDVVVGRVYYDGVVYEVLAARTIKAHDHHASACENFGAWSKARVTVEKEAEAV